MAAEGASTTPPSGPKPSIIQTHPPSIAFKATDVPPTQYIYLQANDFIVLRCLSNATVTNLRFVYRCLTPQGEIKEGLVPFTGSNFPVSTNTYLGECWLLSFNLDHLVAPAAGTWDFVQVCIGRQPPVGGLSSISGTIWEGYVTVSNVTGWPGSPAKQITDGTSTLRSITGSTPAAGAEINEVVPSLRRWTLLAFFATLTTSAAVANRFGGFLIDDGVNPLYKIRNATAQVASTPQNYMIAMGNQFFNDSAGDTLIPFPTTLPLKNPFRIKTSTTALQAGDQWSAPQYLIAEWGLWDA